MRYILTEREAAAAAAQFDAAAVPPAPPALAKLAWHLREHDPPRAERLADAVRAACTPHDCLASDELELAAARATLAKACVRWMANALGSAQPLLAEAQRRFAGLGNRVGMGDAHLLAGFLCDAQGNLEVRDEHRRTGMALYREAGDLLRLQVVRMIHAAETALRDGARGAQLLEEYHRDAEAVLHPAPLAHAAHARALCALHAGRRGEAIAHFQDGYGLGLRAGELREAAVCAMNAGAVCTGLWDYNSVVQWSEHALAISRPRRMHRFTSHALVFMIGAMRVLRRFDEAQALVDETMRLSFEEPPLARSGANRLLVAGRVALDVGEAARGLEHFDAGLAIARHVGDETLLHLHLEGRAGALSRLGRLQDALDAIAESLRLCGDRASMSVHRADALYSLSEIARRHDLPLPAGSEAPNAILHYMQAALDALPSDALVNARWLTEMSAEYEKVGDLPRALRAERAAEQARRRALVQQTEHLATVIRVRHETESARAEAAHQMALAHAEARRAMAEEQAERAKTAFLASMTHELRSPLNTMLGFVRLIERRMEGTPQAEDLRVVRRNAEVLHALVNQVLDASRGEFDGGRWPAQCPGAAPPAPSASSELPLPARSLPSGLRGRLARALDALDVRAVEEVLDELRDRDPELALALAPLAHRFEYRCMRRLLGAH